MADKFCGNNKRKPNDDEFEPKANRKNLVQQTDFDQEIHLLFDSK